ncbi:hypothetical protein GCM10010441_43410 [Kitasatospora paracochleata]
MPGATDGAGRSATLSRAAGPPFPRFTVGTKAGTPEYGCAGSPVISFAAEATAGNTRLVCGWQRVAVRSERRRRAVPSSLRTHLVQGPDQVVCGQDPALRAGPEASDVGYVLTVSCATRIRINQGRTAIRADRVPQADGLPAVGYPMGQVSASTAGSSILRSPGSTASAAYASAGSDGTTFTRRSSVSPPA